MPRDAGKKPNIILVTVDALRGDRMGFAGYKKGITPNFDALAREGVWFRHAYATGTTSPQSFAGITTSTYPLEYGGYSEIKSPRILISEVMQGAGYWTAAVHSTPYLSEYFGYDKGWDCFQFISPLPNGGVSQGRIKGTLRARILNLVSAVHRSLERVRFLDVIVSVLERTALVMRKVIKDVVDPTSAYFTALEINEEVRNTLSRRAPDKPVFLWVHYMDTHQPYALFTRKTGEFLLSIERFIVTTVSLSANKYLCRFFKRLYEHLYDLSLAHVDRAFGELRKMLEQEGLLNNSVVMMTADHGEEFYDHGGFEHPPQLYNENIRVPLIVWGVKSIRGRIERPVSLIDIAPTIASLAQAPIPANYRGGSLLEVSSRDVLSVATDNKADLTGIRYLGCAIIAQGYKLIVMRGEAGTKNELFDIDDNGNKKNCAASSPKIVHELTGRLSKHEYLYR